MAGRQCGIPTGYQDDSEQYHAPQAPSEAYNAMQSSHLRGYSSSSITRSPPRRPVASPPPSYGNEQLPSREDQSVYGGHAVSHPSGPREYQDHYVSPIAAEAPNRGFHQSQNSQSSLAPLTAHGADMATHSPSPPRGPSGYGYGYDQSMPAGRSPYQGDGYDEYVDPRDIADDGDDGLDAPPRQRQSRFSGLGRNAAVGAGAGAAAAGGAGMLRARDASGNYGQVPGGEAGRGGAEKSEWLNRQSSGNKRLKWIVGSIVAIVLIAAIVGGVVGGILSSKRSGGGSGSSTSQPSKDGLYDINSSQVQDLLNNKDLHKVFPGMDYTPLNAQYPACLSNPLDQNNVTLDVAVLSQLTPAIRLYGTDCNQTELVLKAIDLLQYNTTLQVWLGVYLGNNDTTNTRQLNQMYNILDTYPSTHFAGIIVGNEVLYEKGMTITQLGSQLTTVRSQLASRNIDLPVATSDLGDNWTSGLAADSDIVMANVHPFFAGVTPEDAASWTWTFWQEHDAVLAQDTSKGAYPKSIISETGWPSQGGNDCGTGTKCTSTTAGAVAGIDEMNTFMDGWVCQALANATTYFWFEAFDEPWKVMYNDPTTGDYWEPHWGLMDVDRKLKSGLSIPDCDGKTVDKAYP